MFTKIYVSIFLLAFAGGGIYSASKPKIIDLTTRGKKEEQDLQKLRRTEIYKAQQQEETKAEEYQQKIKSQKEALLKANPQIELQEDEFIQLEDLLRKLEDEKIIKLKITEPVAKTSDPQNPLVLSIQNDFLDGKSNIDGKIILKKISFCIDPDIPADKATYAKMVMEDLKNIFVFLRGLDSEDKKGLIDKHFVKFDIASNSEMRNIVDRENLEKAYGEEIVEQIYQTKKILLTLLNVKLKFI